MSSLVCSGRGTGRRDPLNVSFAQASSRPAIGDLRVIFRDRHQRAAAPLLLVIEYDAGSGPRALVSGPRGETPGFIDVELDRAERLAAAALVEPDQYAASLFLHHALDADLASHVRGRCWAPVHQDGASAR